MSPFKKLKELYKDEEYKILLKAPILASLMVISIILLFSLIVVLILSDDPQIIRIILDFIMLSAIIISLILVIRKRYNRAVTVILSCGFFAIGAITISQSFLTKQVIQANALNLTFMLILTALFANSKKQTLFFCLGSLIVLISSSVIALLKGNIYVEIMEPIPQILISTLVLGVSVSALIFLKSIEIKILDDINEKLRQAKIDDIKKFDLISSSAKQMDKTLNLSALAKNTLSASSSIDLKL
ncbi:MAG: hypothetical protein GY756_13010, partial [bacterium]|nr:hypothetical protein [bacterium]